MRFIDECTNTLQVGQFVQYNDSNLLDTLSTGRNLGLCVSIKTESVSVGDDLPRVDKLIAEIVTHGSTNIPLSEPASCKGTDLYRNGSMLTTVPNGDVVAILIPKGFGSEKVDYASGDLATIVMI
jgi:hypothetical protein